MIVLRVPRPTRKSWFRANIKTDLEYAVSACHVKSQDLIDVMFSGLP